jgi:hypothetical protein
VERRASPPVHPDLYCTSIPSLALKHLDAVDVDLVPIDVPGHGDVMPFVTLQGIGIVHRQDLLVSVGNDDWAGASCDALLSAPALAPLTPHFESLTQPLTVWASLANDTDATNPISAQASNNKRNFRMSSSSD